MESEEESPLFKDPLAAVLAGDALLKEKARQRSLAPPGSNRRFKVNMFAIRTRWFDDQLEASLGMLGGQVPAQAGETNDGIIPYIAKTFHPGYQAKQVVVLGAGMDSRPWRLHLPSGISWFEVDRDDVLSMKMSLLAQAGAEVGQQRRKISSHMSFNTRLERKIGTLDHHTSGVVFPLRADAWTAVVADLGSPTWVTALEDCGGFDPEIPTIWVAEGLLMYLSEERAADLLKELASLSCKGSALITMNVTEDVIRKVKVDPKASALMQTWKFGCPVDPTDWLARLGWQSQLVTTRRDMARALKLSSDVCSFEAGLAESTKTSGGKTIFMVATPMNV